MGKKVDAKDFVTEAFDYLNTLTEVSINRSTNRYLMEYIAYGFALYGETVEQFENNAGDWIRMLCKVYPELGYDYKNHQIYATIDLIDHLIVVDDDLIVSLKYCTDILKKYGILINYKTKKGDNVTTTISRFFEHIEKMYPVIKARYKGLGSSSADVSEEVIMDPKTRRLVRVTMDDPQTWNTFAMLVGDSKENKDDRKEMLMNFKFSMDMIDN